MKPTACYLSEEEDQLLERLQKELRVETSESHTKSIVLRKAVINFLENPTEVDLPPRAAYRRDVTSLKRIPFSLEESLLTRLDEMAEDYSSSRNQIVRHSLKQYAHAKIKASTVHEEDSTWPEAWEEVTISAIEAARLAGTTRAIINRNGNLERYPFIEVEGKGPLPKKLYKLTDIARHYKLSKDEVLAYLQTMSAQTSATKTTQKQDNNSSE